MGHARRLILVGAVAFAGSFLIAVPLHWMPSELQSAGLVVWVVFALCASVVAAHSTGLFAVLVAPATVVVAVAGVYLGGYAPYGLSIGDLEPSDYGCCDLGTGAEGVWARIVVGSYFGGIVGVVVGAIVWLAELFYATLKEDKQRTGLDGTLRR